MGRINKDVVKDAFENSVPRREDRGRTRRRVIRWFLRILGWYIVVMLVGATLVAGFAGFQHNLSLLATIDLYVYLPHFLGGVFYLSITASSIIRRILPDTFQDEFGIEGALIVITQYSTIITLLTIIGVTVGEIAVAHVLLTGFFY